jgi:hypothetical protein
LHEAVTNKLKSNTKSIASAGFDFASTADWGIEFILFSASHNANWTGNRSWKNHLGNCKDMADGTSFSMAPFCR